MGEKGIVQADELHPLTIQEVKWKPGRDGRKRKVLLTRLLREPKVRVFEKFLAQKLRKLNTTILCVPMGMTRQKENKTTLNRKTGRVNWQVEWMMFGRQDSGSSIDDKKPTRMLSKVMDDVPLHHAYHNMLEDQARSLGLLPKKTIAGCAQGPREPTWHSVSGPLQDPSTGTWFSIHTADAGIWPDEKEKIQRQSHQFFLGHPTQRADRPTTITRLEVGDCLRDILTNTRVLEFPTVYILRNGEPIPSGFVLGAKDSTAAASVVNAVASQHRQHKQQSHQQGIKRKGGPSYGEKPLGSSKRRMADGKGKNTEEGEVGSDEGEANGQSDDEATYGEHSGSKGSTTALEAGEVIAEQSLGEDNDDDDDDDDSTSSSGSDSE